MFTYYYDYKDYIIQYMTITGMYLVYNTTIDQNIPFYELEDAIQYIDTL